MALQVWLPLTGNLKNLGLSKTSQINTTNLSFLDNGKIGKCLTGYTGYFNIPSMAGKKQFSVAYWIKINTATSTNWLDAFRWYSTDGTETYGSRNEFYTNCTLTGFWFAGSPNSISGKTTTVGEWHHNAFVIDYSTGIAKFYINGVSVGSVTNVYTTHYLTGENFMIGEKGLDASINDVRIYDNCLSPKEVKELSKGLIAHYPLNDEIGGENLMPNSNIMGLGSANPSTGTWRLAGTSTMTKSRLLIEDSPIGKCYCFQNSGVQTANDGSCYGIDSFPLEANTQYTISMFARIVDGREGYAGYNVYHISSEDGGTHTKIDKNYRVTPLNEDGSWTRCIYTFTTNASTTRNIYIGITTGTENVTTQMCLIKIEKGSIVTPWTPNLNDELYSTLGLDNGIVYDCSGYGHDGNIVGSISINSEAPRYTVSSSFSGNEQILAESPTAEAKSASLWIYIPSIETNNLVFADYKSKLAFGFYSSYIVTAVTGDNNYRTTYESSLLTNNSWHHIVIVKSESSGMELWIDGVKQTPRSGYDAWSSGMSDGLTIGARTNGNNKFIGSISDLRIYATALSAEDIKSLYETRASIDNYSNTYAYEFMEV